MLEIVHLYHYPQLTTSVARMIYDEFWRDVVNGMSQEDLVTHLRTATDVDRIPLCLIALQNDEFIGTVNLIENDDSNRTHLRPWLAAMVVRADHRGAGVGTKLVGALLMEARRMQIPRVFFGTDGPGFYERMGAITHEEIRTDFRIMKFELA